MQLTAKLIHLLPIQTGTGKNGEWKKQDIIVETDAQYSKKLCISIWGDKINQQQLVLGSKLTIDFDVESREYNNKWYTDIKASRIETSISSISNSENTINTDFNINNESEEDVLPF